METAHFGVFEPTRFSSIVQAVEGQKPFFSDAVPLTREERDVAILTGKLPAHEQEHGRRDETSLANWLTLMNL